MPLKVMLRSNWRYLVATLALLVGLAILAHNVSAAARTNLHAGAETGSGSTHNKAADIPNDTFLVGHVNWVGVINHIRPITLTLMMGSTEIDYPAQNTDASGFFTVS